MGRFEIARPVSAHRARHAQKTGMFSGAVVVQRRWRLPGTVKRRGGGLMDRCMRPAAERRDIEAGTRENALSGRDVVRLAAMGGASESKLRFGQGEALRRPRFH